MAEDLLYSGFKRRLTNITKKPNVRDIIILNSQGNPIKTAMVLSRATQHAGSLEILRGIQKINPVDELLMLRLRTKSNEIMLVPDGKITVAVTQEAEDRSNT
uniref:Robl_LC7 domain-containing protein n=1 Tax=Glossina brevipalpis TaxID=37001 RepID=A0A1A9WQR1_9MUSC